MRIVRSHNLGKQAARDMVERELPGFISSLGDNISNPQAAWRGDAVEFSFHALGSDFRGTVNIADTELALDLRIPLRLRLFQATIKIEIERRMDEYLRE